MLISPSGFTGEAGENGRFDRSTREMRTELLRQLHDLDGRRQALLDGLETLTHEQLAFKPAPDKWSILQVVEHLVLAEQEIFKRVPDQGAKSQGKRRLRDRISYIFVVLVLRLGLPVPVVSREMEPEGTSSLAATFFEWGGNRRRGQCPLLPPGSRSADTFANDPSRRASHPCPPAPNQAE